MNEINIEQAIVENVIGCFDNWGKRIEIGDPDGPDFAAPRCGATYLGDPATEMTCEVEGYGEFRIVVTVERMPDPRPPHETCSDCNYARHQCPGCGTSIAHGAVDCRGAGGPGCPVYEELVELLGDPADATCDECTSFDDDPSTWCDCGVALDDEPCKPGSACKQRAHHPKDCPGVDVPVSHLTSGDSIFSAGGGTWHRVRIDHDAFANAKIMFLERNGTWVKVGFPGDKVFRARRGATGRAAGALLGALGGEVIRDERGNL